LENHPYNLSFFLVDNKFCVSPLPNNVVAETSRIISREFTLTDFLASATHGTLPDFPSFFPGLPGSKQIHDVTFALSSIDIMQFCTCILNIAEEYEVLYRIISFIAGSAVYRVEHYDIYLSLLKQLIDLHTTWAFSHRYRSATIISYFSDDLVSMLIGVLLTFPYLCRQTVPMLCRFIATHARVQYRSFSHRCAPS